MFLPYNYKLWNIYITSKQHFLKIGMYGEKFSFHWVISQNCIGIYWAVFIFKELLTYRLWAIRDPPPHPAHPPGDFVRPIFSTTMMSRLYIFARLPKNKCHLYIVIAPERSLGAIKQHTSLNHSRSYSISPKRMK